MAEPTQARDRRQFHRRVRVLFAMTAAGLALVGVRAVQLQVAQHDELSRMSRGQYLNDVKVPAWRGQILDRNGKALAASVEVPSVYAHPLEIEDPRQAARKLAKVLSLDLDATYQKLASEKYFVWLARQVTPEIARGVTELGLAGVGITKEPRRFYPNLEVAANVVGFAGREARGLEGVELALDEELEGDPQVIEAVRDARGRSVLTGSLDPEGQARGADVTLTLDLQIQHAAQAALRDTVTEQRAESGLAVVLDVATSEILALAMEPSFNPNNAGALPAAQRRNKPVTDVFEPASTMKPLVVAGALDAGVVDKSTILFCENGALKVGSHTIRDDHPAGWMGLTGILQKSSNIGMAKIGQLLGRERLASVVRGYGLGQRTGVELPGETAGLVRPASTWSSVGVATVAFGHGIAVNALQLAAAYRVLAADGMYRAPRLVRRIAYADGREVTITPSAARRVLKSSSVRTVLPMLEAAVSDEGTGFRARVPGYRVAGKTGTAQKLDPIAGGYSSDRHVAVFAGFLPSDAPRVVIAVAVDEPKKDYMGGLVAAPVFARIGEAAMRVLGVVPSPSLAHEAGKPIATAPAVPAKAAAESPAMREIVTAPGSMPSFLGLTARQVMARYSDLGLQLDLQLEGSGRVVEQDPLPGTTNTEAKRVRLVLARSP